MASGRGADKNPLPPPLPSPQCSYILCGVNFALFQPSCKLGCHVEAKHLHGESTSSAGEKHEKLVLMKPFISAEFDDILRISNLKLSNFIQYLHKGWAIHNDSNLSDVNLFVQPKLRDTARPSVCSSHTLLDTNHHHCNW